MKFQYASDLHLEFRDNYTHLMELEPLKPVAPYLILAGDIDIIGLEEVLRYDIFKFLSEHWKEVFIIPGNHEYYKKGDVSESFNIDYHIFPNVRYLNHQKIHLEGVDFYFTTLWSRTGSSLIKTYISDFRSCKYGSQPFSYKHHDELHNKAVFWLNRELNKDKEYPRVVISHFVPCPAADGYPDSTDNYIGSIIKRYFVADLGEKVMNWDIDYWIYGHNHWDKDVDALGVKFRSNQFG